MQKSREELLDELVSGKTLEEVCKTEEGIAYLINRNGRLRDYLVQARKALIEVQGYLPTTYLTLVKELDDSEILK